MGGPSQEQVCGQVPLGVLRGSPWDVVSIPVCGVSSPGTSPGASAGASAVGCPPQEQVSVYPQGGDLYRCQPGGGG